MDKKEDNAKPLGTVGMMVGGAGVLALSALDGGILTLIGCGALAYGSGAAVSSAMMPRDESGKKTDRYERDLGISRYVVAGSCALATFLNPFVGIPGTILLLILRNVWGQEVKAIADQVEAEQAERKRASHGVSHTRQAMFA